MNRLAQLQELSSTTDCLQTKDPHKSKGLTDRECSDTESQTKTQSPQPENLVWRGRGILLVQVSEFKENLQLRLRAGVGQAPEEMERKEIHLSSAVLFNQISQLSGSAHQHRSSPLTGPIQVLVSSRNATTGLSRNNASQLSEYPQFIQLGSCLSVSIASTKHRYQNATWRGKDLTYIPRS